MKHIPRPGFLLIFALFLCSCSFSPPDGPWTDAVPRSSPFIILPEENATLHSVLESTYIPFLDDITSSAIQLVSQVDSTSAASLPLKSIVLYPGAGNRLETVWMAEAPRSFLEALRKNFYRNYTQNQYYFRDVTIHRLHIHDRILFASQLNEVLLFSESSLGIEDAIRAYLGETPRLDLSELQPEPGHIVMNTPILDGWFEQILQVGYRPTIMNILHGTKPALLSISQEGEQQSREFRMSGQIPLGNPRTDLTASFSSKNAPVTLDRYISSNAAGFALMRMEPRMAPPTSLPDTSEADSVLMGDKVRYANIAKTLSDEFAAVLYSESGFLSTGEHLFLRKVNDVAGLRRQLNELRSEGHISFVDGVYFVRGRALAEIIGSSLCSFDNFYLDLTGDVVVISKRKGLTDVVASDRSRRRVIYYDSDYRELKDRLPGEVSGFLMANREFYPFMEPFLRQNSYVEAITSKYDLMAASARLDEEGESLSFNLQTYQTAERSAPYEEQWLVPAGDSELTGEPILADIGGSAREEIIFATPSGRLFALATDGTVALELDTGGDTPVGSPVAYDWYGTNQNVILVAAGNKIYGWNENGEPLPQFPFTLDEQITSPLVVGDFTRDGLPEALVATADRRLHMLNNRGDDRDGWPVTTNSAVESKPAVASYYGSRSVLAFSSNAVHAWTMDGSAKEGFPKFINASLSGSPVLHGDRILAGAADGYLYAIGPGRQFADSLNVYNTSSGSSDIEAVYVSGSSLTGIPSARDLTVQSDQQTYAGTMILTMGSNGSVFLLSEDGRLLFNRNMGQPSAAGFSPFITDLDSNGEPDVVTLANFGRLYGWQLSDGERIYSLPTTAMKFPIVADIDGDGYKEIIAHTSRGLRCWTFYGE